MSAGLLIILSFLGGLIVAAVVSVVFIFGFRGLRASVEKAIKLYKEHLARQNKK